VNDNGTIKHFGTDNSDYAIDVIRRETQQFIDRSVAERKPFFAYVSPTAPHAPYTPAPRDEHAFDGIKAPRLPSFNEQDVSDKPPWIRQLPRLTEYEKAAMNSRHEGRVENLQALDDLVEGVVEKLRGSGTLGNTYIFFTSDNGWHHGEHRILKGKSRAYEESIHVPLLVRGPSVQEGSTTHELALNTDYLPTFTNLAGVSRPEYVDGRSLRPVIKGDATTWRSAILLEARYTNTGQSAPISYYGIRTSSGSKYVAYEGGFGELYEVGADPYELRNRYNAAAPPSALATRLQALKACAGTSCRSAENGQ
jgi:N-acetylglucosamine-6-sulfatase